MHTTVYLDNAATTPVRPEVLEAMMPFLTDRAFGNPSSSHNIGRTARAGVEEARRRIRAILKQTHVSPEDVLKGLAEGREEIFQKHYPQKSHVKKR